MSWTKGFQALLPRRRFLVRPVQHRGLSSSTTAHPIDINYVKNIMKKWVQTHVIDHDLCPFAKTSDYRIAVWPSSSLTDQDGQDVTAFLHQEIQNQISNTSRNRPNTLVIFPWLEDFLEDGLAFHEFYLSTIPSIPGAGTYLDFDNPSCQVQFFLFHRDQNLRFITPWPTLHLLRRSDLDKVRQGKDDLSAQISHQNEATLSDPNTRDKLVRNVLEYAKFPPPIRITRPISTEQRTRLQAEGYHVVEELESLSPDKTLRLSPKKSTKGKKKKKKR